MDAYFILLILSKMDKDPQDMSMNANRNVYDRASLCPVSLNDPREVERR